MDKAARGDRPERRRREGRPRDAGSGEGAASALATLRELERNRTACEPIDEAPPPPAEQRDGGTRPGSV